MNRREFVTRSLVGITGSAVGGSFARARTSEPSAQPQVGDDWRDPQLRALRLPIPAFPGQSYQAEVPDTLDLTDRARLSINAITRLLDPEYDYEQFTFAELRSAPPALILDGGLVCLNPKWAEALPLTRIMTGSTENIDVDPHLLESFIHNTGRDGLVYQPPDRPGAFYTEFARKQGKPYNGMYGEGRQLLAYSVWTQLSSSPLYRGLAERKIARLQELAVPSKGGGLYFRRGIGYTPGEKNTDKIPIFALTDHEVMDPSLGIVGTAACEPVGGVAMGLGRYYLVTGYEPALNLARGLANYFRHEARLIDDFGTWHGWHFHEIALGTLGTIEYGVAANDQDMLHWAQRAYEYGKSIGDPIIGFFAGVPRAEPVSFNPNSRENGMDSRRMETEPCSIADMALIALKLTHAGLGDYYEDVEHYLRNLLVEEQITNTDFLPLPTSITASEQIKKTMNSLASDPREVSTDHAAERAVGSFVNARPNQWYLGVPGPQACGCCLGNATRVMYYAWDSILQSQGSTLRVNLLLNRASAWADLNSYLPYQGKVVLKMKQAKIPRVRIPSWTDRLQVSCAVNGKRQEYRWEGSYIRVGAVEAGDEVVVSFPMVERTLQREIKSHKYTVTVRGFTVVELLPKPDLIPLFQRADHRRAQAPMKKVTRFVSEQRITW